MYKGPKQPADLLPRELSDGLPEELRNLDVPAYERARYRRESTINGLVAAVQEQLDSGQESYIRSRSGVYISESQFVELRRLRVGFKAQGLPVHMPSPEDAANIFREAYKTVDDKMPREYQEEARERLRAIEPKYARNLDELAAAPGIELPHRDPKE